MWSVDAILLTEGSAKIHYFHLILRILVLPIVKPESCLPWEEGVPHGEQRHLMV